MDSFYNWPFYFILSALLKNTKQKPNRKKQNEPYKKPKPQRKIQLKKKMSLRKSGSHKPKIKQKDP